MEVHHGLNILDYSVFGIILLSGLLALMRGFIREVLSLGAWIGAYFVSAKYHTLAEPWAHRYIKNDTGASVLAALVIFIATLIILSLAGYLIARLVRGRALNAIDRSLGFLFGLLRGVLIVCLVYLGATYIPWLNMDKLDRKAGQETIAENTEQGTAKEEKEKDQPPEWLAQAKTRPALARGANLLKAFIPEKDIEKTMRQYDEQKSSARRMIDQQAYDMLSPPGGGAKPTEKPSSYDDKERSNLNQLIIQQSKP
ncbi:MAG: CvpA family protein [Alphaproteobacteria bacterium]|nr:CvpA family protein [Alphaproteobacteria bacterium]